MWMSSATRYRLVTPSTGREVIVDAQPGHTYRDRETGEVMVPVGKPVPLTPKGSLLPWAVENLIHCPYCEQMTEKDANDCTTCGRRIPASNR